MKIVKSGSKTTIISGIIKNMHIDNTTMWGPQIKIINRYNTLGLLFSYLIFGHNLFNNKRNELLMEFLDNGNYNR